MRRATALGVLIVPLLAATAVAAPKPSKVCQLLTDPSGDTGLPQASAPIEAPSLDILSADIASSAKTLAGVIRVRSLRDDPTTTVGAQYILYFYVGEAEWRLTGKRQNGSNDVFTLRPPGTGASDSPIDGKFDTATNAIYFSVPRKAVPELKNFKVTGLRSVASVSPPGTALDSAEGNKAYVDLTPSCLPA